MKNLISNTAFGKNLDTLELSLSAYKQIRQQFDSFLLRGLEKWMFVPCDENGVIFEEPERIHFSTEFDYKAELSVYQEAKGRVLFEGFIFRAENEKSFTVELNGETFWIEKNETIEDLLGFDHEFELTQNAKNQIGL